MPKSPCGRERLVVYVAGAYTGVDEGAVLGNVEAAMSAGLEILRRGHFPYVPHLCHFLEMLAIKQTGKPVPYETWMRVGGMWLESCTAFLQISSSPGADREALDALAHGIPIYNRVDELPDLGGWPS